MVKTAVYLRDIKPSMRNEAFFGKGLNKLIKKAEKDGDDIIVGYYINKPKIDN